MIQLELTKVIHPQTMGPDQTPTLRKYCVPIDMIGPLEEDDKGYTILTLRNNGGSVIINESIEEIKERINALMAAQLAATQARMK